MVLIGTQDDGEQVSCLACNSRFSTYASLAQHLDTLHNGKNSKLARYDDSVPDVSREDTKPIY